MSQHSPLTGIHGLSLLPEGRVQLGDRVHSASDEILGSLPGDWAVHKPAGVGQALKCKRGDGSTKLFVFREIWVVLDADQEVIPLQVAESPSKISIIDEVYLRECSLGKDELFRGLNFENKRDDITFLTSGGLILDGVTYTAHDDVNGISDRASITKYYRRGGTDSLLVAIEQASTTIYLFDSTKGWFRLSRVSYASARKQNYFGDYHRWHRRRSVLTNLITFGRSRKPLREYLRRLDTDPIVILVFDEKMTESEPSVLIRLLDRYTNAEQLATPHRWLKVQWEWDLNSVCLVMFLGAVIGPFAIAGIIGFIVIVGNLLISLFA